MKKLILLVCGALLLPLSALSDPLVISASGRGASEILAVASAKKQAAADAQLAGFLPQDGYRIGNTRVLEVKPVGAAYVARLDAELVQGIASKRILFVVSREQAQTPRLLALVQRVRTALSEQQSINQPRIEVKDAIATGALRINTLSDLQRSGLDAELDQIARKNEVDALYLLNASNENSPVFLVAAWKDGVSGKTIRTLRDSASGNNATLTSQVLEAILQDVGTPREGSPVHSIVILPTSGVTVRRGQSVIIYADKNSEDGVLESSIVTHGIVTEVSGTKVRVLTEHPVAVSLGSRLRFTPLPKRGSIITESDW